MAFADYDFSKHNGINKSAATALRQRFASWEEIAQAPPEQLLEVRGIGTDNVEDLIDTARAQIRLAERQRPRGEESIVDRARDTKKNYYVLTEKVADFVGRDSGGRLLNIKRRRKLLTPAICADCGMDLAERMGVSWDKASPATRDQIEEKLAKHQRDMHSLATRRVIDEDELNAIGRMEGNE